MCLQCISDTYSDSPSHSTTGRVVVVGDVVGIVFFCEFNNVSKWVVVILEDVRRLDSGRECYCCFLVVRR